MDRSLVLCTLDLTTFTTDSTQWYIEQQITTSRIKKKELNALCIKNSVIFLMILMFRKNKFAVIENTILM